MSSPPSELPEPIPARPAQPARGRDRALSAVPGSRAKKGVAPPEPSVANPRPAPEGAAPYEYAPPETPPPRATISPASAPEAFTATGSPAAPGSTAQAGHRTFPHAPAIVRNHKLVWLMVFAVVGVALAFTIPFTVGVYFGNRDREQYLERQAVEHFQRALAYESETYTELAIAELNLALQYKPDYQPARDKLQQLKTVRTAASAPEPQDVAIADQLYSGAREALGKQAWSDAIDLLEELRRVKSDYRSGEVTAALVTAYVNAGKQALAAPDVDLAQRRFEAALALDPNNAEARTFHDRAILYANGVQAMGNDWTTAVAALGELYKRDPNFGDVQAKLRDSHVGYGDFASKGSAYCIAAREYDSALALGADAGVQAKSAAANDLCKQAILNPTATATPTIEGEQTPVPGATGTRSPGGTGGILYRPQVRVRQNAQCGGTGDIKGAVADGQGNPLANIGIKIYNDYGYLPPYARTDDAGEYVFGLGTDKGLFHLVVVDDFGSNVSRVLDVDYPGGNVQGCHIVVDWARTK